MSKVYNDAGKEISLANGYSEEDVKEAKNQISEKPNTLNKEESKYYEDMQDKADALAMVEEDIER